MKKKIYTGITTCMFAVLAVFNLNFIHINNENKISLEEFAVMAKACGESGNSNDPKIVGTVPLGDGSAMQYEANGQYYQYTQSATKYYDPQTQSYFYEVQAPRVNASSSTPFSGAIIVSPMQTGTIF